MTVVTRAQRYWTLNFTIIALALLAIGMCLEVAETDVPPGERAEYECPACRRNFEMLVPDDGAAPSCPACGPRERLTRLGRAH